MNLYQIDAELMNFIDMETGEIEDEKRYFQLEMERDSKIENTALYIKNLAAMEKAFAHEIYELRQRKDKVTRQKNKYEKYLTSYMAGAKFETPKVKISFSKSARVIVEKDAKLPGRYIRTRITTEPDRIKLREAIKAGESINGVVLVESQSINIK